jgi:hypothetical protein
VVEDWNTWLNSYEKWLVERDKDYYFEQYFQRDKPTWTDTMDRLRGFLVPTLVIPKFHPEDADRIAEVCAIFEKMNSSGVRLSVYDLLTARLYKYGVDQHGLWEQSAQQHSLLNTFSDGKPDDYGVYVLRTIALMRGSDVKSKTLINMRPGSYEDDWREATKYMEKALQRITSIAADGFGVFDAKWQPYSTMISPLAAMLWAIDTRKLGHDAYRLMRRWYWSSVFRERYAGSVESTIARDFQDFLRATDDPTFEPEAIRDARINIIESEGFTLRSVSRLNSVYRSLMCLVALRGAKDFQADDSIEFHTLEDHHIFPKAYLGQQKGDNDKPLPNDLVNTILNRTLISAQANRRISKSRPSDYLSKLVPDGRLAEIMDSHFINAGALAAMQADDYETFLRSRERALLTEMAARING